MKTKFLRAMGVGLLSAVSLTVQAGVIPTQGTWTTTLQGRDLDGDPSTFEAYYDTVLGITWLADANYAKTSGAHSSGLMTWSAAKAWAEALDIYGFNDWRLPMMVDTGALGCEEIAYSGTDCGFNVQTVSGGVVYSELASMFYDTLGNLGQFDTSGNSQSDYGLTNTGPFTNLVGVDYWFGLEYPLDTDQAWRFSFGNGLQNNLGKDNGKLAWAVRSGDVAPVPIPATVWLFGSGLIGLLGLARRRG